MIPEELLKKVKWIEITTRKVVDDVLSGQYRSHFKGQGVQFSEHRPYVPGDDVRHIDWKVSARTREPLIKKFEEERQLTVFLVVDASASASFGSSTRLKSEMIAEIGGMIASAASHTGDRIGALIFADHVEKIIPPKKGKQHVLRVIRDLLTFKTRTRGTGLSGALDATGRVMKHQGVVFVISDFLANGYERPLKRLARRHDVVAIRIADEREQTIPELGQVLFIDPESGQERLVNTSSYSFQKWFKEYQIELEKGQQAVFKGGQIEILNVLTKDDYGEAVVRFFRARARRRK
jgi:uncharacterized protein (DUF58 family)